MNQGGRRKGAAAIYLETWHCDIEEFLELRDNTGEDARRTHNLNLAHWVPDEFMRRVSADEQWSLFSPSDVPELVDLWGEEFDAAYRRAEAAGLARKTLPARELYGRMMRTLAQTGNGWMTFKDTANRTANQTAEPGHVIHSSNLCTEILEVTSDGETAVCNLGSVNLGAFVDPAAGDLDWERLDAAVRTAVTFLDRVVDINFYPTEEAGRSNARWRPVGLGAMGLQDVFFKLRLPFDSPEAKALSTRIAERIMLAAYEASADLAERNGPLPAWELTRTARGVLHPDHYDVEPAWPERWAALRERIAAVGMRNSLLLAIAPTATIASITGAYECIEPQVSNLFKRETLSGEFLQVNSYLVDDLKRLGVWDARTREALREANGSVQDFTWIPEDVRRLYRTAWEIPQRALIDMAAARTAYLDQAQSLNLFMETPTIGKLSSMYAYAWKSGLKTTYYLRSRPATRIARAARATVPVQAAPTRGGRLLPGKPRVLRGLPVMSTRTQNLLDPGFELTLRPMRYPDFYERYRDAIKNTWTVEEVDLHSDVADLAKLSPAEQHLIGRLVAFFATGDSIVANNLVLTLYKHINSPEARLYLSRQLFEEAVHVQFYLTLLDTYLPDPDDRAAAFAAVENIPSIREKAEFCFRWMDSVEEIDRLRTQADRRRFLLNLICFAACIEGLFFYGAFAYVYWFRSRGLLHGLATGTNWVFRDETMHMSFAFDVVDTVRKEEPELFDDALGQQVTDMLKEAVEAELQFARDLCGDGLPGMNTESMRQYLECVADQRLTRLGFAPVYGSENPFSFMELQGVQELTNFFERRPSAYQVAVEGTVDLSEDF